MAKEGGRERSTRGDGRARIALLGGARAATRAATLAAALAASGCTVTGGASGGTLEPEDLARDARPRQAFATEGSAHEFRTLFSALDITAFAGAGRDAANGVSLPRAPFALVGVGFPQVETAPPAKRRPSRRYVRLLDWRVAADGGTAGRPFARIRCMNLAPRTVARRAAPFVPTIERIAAGHGLDPALVKAVIARESCFDPSAVSRAGAIGLMQLMPATARELRSGDPRKPANNLRAGIRYLAELHRMYDGDVELALAAYNAGPGNVRRYGGIPPFAETRAYVRKVLAYQRRYRAVELYASL